MLKPQSADKPVETWAMWAKVIVSTPDTTEGFHVYWHQAGNHYDVRFSTFLGISLAHLVGDSDQVYLDVPRQARRYANSPSQLLTNITNVTWPIELLRYWFRGEKIPSELQPLLTLGWQVDYLAWHNDLPKKFRVFCQEQQIQVLVIAWL